MLFLLTDYKKCCTFASSKEIKHLTKEKALDEINKALDERKKAGAEKERRTADMRMSE